MSCDFHEPYFGASYPDACCIDGYLWDLDSCDEPGGSLSRGGDIPCPQCNHDEWLESFADGIRDDGYAAADRGGHRTCVPKPIRWERPGDQEKVAKWFAECWDERASENQTGGTAE